MTTSLTIPKSTVPIGRLTVGGLTYDVPQHPEFVRFFFDLARRAGGTSAQTNTDLQVSIDTLDSETLVPQSLPEAQEALRGVGEIRNELSSLRSDCDALRSALAECEVQFAAIRAVSDLRPRVEQLEDRLT